MLNELRDKVYKNAIDHGFYDEEVNIPEKLMLIVSELGEAMEAYRKDHHSRLDSFYTRRHYIEKTDDIAKRFDQDIWDKDFEETIKDTIEDELIDSIIRLLDLCGYMKIDVDEHLALKMRYNASRPYKHGKIC